MTKIVVLSTIPSSGWNAGPLQRYPLILVNLFKFLVHVKLIERKPMIIILVYCRIYYSQVQWIHESGTADRYFNSKFCTFEHYLFTYLLVITYFLAPRG